MAEEVIATLHALEEDPAARGVVLGSAVKGIFSAGLHLPDLLLDEDGSTSRLVRYWTSVQEMWLALYTTPLATAAAISGHSPAGPPPRERRMCSRSNVNVPVPVPVLPLVCAHFRARAALARQAGACSPSRATPA